MGNFNKLKTFNLPASGIQFHLHTDQTGNYIGESSLKTNAGEKVVRLDNYQAAMADFYAQQLGFKSKKV